jgi:hypothetical protein
MEGVLLIPNQKNKSLDNTTPSKHCSIDGFLIKNPLSVKDF